MNEHVKEIANKLQQEYGLEQYVLKREHIFSETTQDNQTNYILSLEWFPVHQSEENEEYNPEGTAVLEVNLHTNELKQLIFVNDVSYATEGIFPAPELESVIEWVEEETGMMFGRQFKLDYEDGTAFSFQATVDNIAVAPSGNIDITFNENNQLTQFSIDGVFPSEKDIDWEPFSLMKEDLMDYIKQQLKLIETPIEEEEKWLKVWTMDTIFIRNDKTNIIIPASLYQLDTYKELNVLLEWDSTSQRDFTPKDIDFSTEVSYEDAMAKIRVNPLTEDEIQSTIEETKDFLSNLYPDDSGKWTLTGMYPEGNYIIAELKLAASTPLDRKLKVIISRDSLQTANYWDSKLLFEVFESYAKAEEATIPLDEAFGKIIEHVELTPVYVKDPNSDSYHLCGRLDCEVVVIGTTGEIVPISQF
ncbi:hypothetical protein H8S33_01530 [Ornithinibacillus sp. BX22]|uniref:Uncharacterized protein n=1 Tax=Ornithinibacillus hominis TaxID=2763055 RepID=A0A923RFJ8_9BACI|nr:hypothetical protein [Ornithinibacillus hominis]MBC5635495.1 hypothetical protein [Ornithinibacillus hominis]